MLPFAQLCGRRCRKSGATKIGYNHVPTRKTVRVVDEKMLKDLEGNAEHRTWDTMCDPSSKHILG